MKTQPAFTESHPSYGVISLSRQSTNRSRLFGCATSGHVSMCLAVSEASLVRHSETDNTYIHAQKHILEIVMSPLQLAELMTSGGSGEGIPCTISWRDGKFIPGPEHSTTHREMIEESFRKNMCALGRGCDEILAEARALCEKTSVNKSDRANFVKLAEGLVNHITAATPYVAGQFTDVIERMMAEIKTDANANAAPTPPNAAPQ